MIAAFQHAALWAACQHFSWLAFQALRQQDLADMLTSRPQGGVLKC
jgi:hypothetical protein